MLEVFILLCADYSGSTRGKSQSQYFICFMRVQVEVWACLPGHLRQYMLVVRKHFLSGNVDFFDMDMDRSCDLEQRNWLLAVFVLALLLTTHTDLADFQDFFSIVRETVQKIVGTQRSTYRT